MTLSQLFAKLAKGRSPDLRIQMLRYLVAGGTAFLVDAGLLALLTECGGRSLLLLWTAIAFTVGLCITYLFSILWVFDNRSMKNQGAEAGVFALIGLSGLGLTELLMWLLSDGAGMHYMLSKIITTVLVFVWNFAAKKLILFRSR